MANQIYEELGNGQPFQISNFALWQLLFAVSGLGLTSACAVLPVLDICLYGTASTDWLCLLGCYCWSDPPGLWLAMRGTQTHWRWWKPEVSHTCTRTTYIHEVRCMCVLKSLVCWQSLVMLSQDVPKLTSHCCVINCSTLNAGVISAILGDYLTPATLCQNTGVPRLLAYLWHFRIPKQYWYGFRPSLDIPELPV